MLKKSYNEDGNFYDSDINLNTIAKLERKMKQLEYCQNLQNSLLLNKVMNKEKESKAYDIFPKSEYSVDFNKNESILDNSPNSNRRRNGKWTKEEVTLLKLINKGRTLKDGGPIL